MTLEEFSKSRFCKQLILSPEDEPQDIEEWRRLVREDQQRQYKDYCLAHDSVPLATSEGVPVRGFDKVAYQREYMKKWRLKRKALK